MSLKAFHIVFIVVSILFSLGFGLWNLKNYSVSGVRADLWWGLGGVAAALALAWYGKRVLKKLKHISYL